jgi:aryl-alcohol dehydrogenase-like predicted oxidoreductase
MHTRVLGQDLRVSAIGQGAMGMSQSYGPNPGDRAMMAVLRGAIERGVTFFDTAEVYGPYVNEELADLDELVSRIGVQGNRYNEHHLSLVGR